jgi:tRNA (guanosine-2'-O-)-methyltransferase
MAQLVDIESQISLKYRLQRGAQLRVDDHHFEAEHVCRILGEHVTESRRERIAEVVAERTFSVAVVAEHLYDIGNISAVMRSAESFGYLPFHIVERPDSKYKMSDRISRGTEKWLDIHRSQSCATTFSKLRKEGYQIFATDLKATHQLQQIDFSKKTAVVFGNEKEGISDYMREHADGTFIIPMYGFAQSFNISVAAALTFFHIHSARCQALKSSGDLTEVEKAAVTAQYYMRTLDSYKDILMR